MTRTAVVLFTRDLRVHDHPALAAARRDCDRVVPLFVLDERLLAASAKRTRFLHELLPRLRVALGLVVANGDLFSLGTSGSTGASARRTS
jgi:deoxyribodipyrimidine photo-lyase